MDPHGSKKKATSLTIFLNRIGVRPPQLVLAMKDKKMGSESGLVAVRKNHEIEK